MRNINFNERKSYHSVDKQQQQQQQKQQQEHQIKQHKRLN